MTGLADAVEEARWASIVAEDPTAAPLGGPRRRRMVCTPAAEIQPRRVLWTWDGRIAAGTLSLVSGREGVGKSTVVSWLGARITRGQLEGEFFGQPRSVLINASEDSWEHTIVPRYLAAGADMDRIFRIEMIDPDDIHLGLSFPRDLQELERTARKVDAALLILDPLMSRLGDDLDTHRDGDVRRALEPLVAVADRTAMSVIGLIHHNKSGSSDPLQLVMASKAFTAVARSVHSVIPDPDDETDTRRLFGTPKNNLGKGNLPTLTFTVASHAIDTDDGTAWTGRIEWGGSVEGSISDAMRRATDNADDRSATTEAADWLRDYLEMQGGSASSAEIKTAGHKEGHSQDALKRARRKLDLTVESVGFPKRTYWRTQSERQLEQQSEQNARGEFINAPTAPTEPSSPQLVQLEQLEQHTDGPAPTVRQQHEAAGRALHQRTLGTPPNNPTEETADNP